MRRYVRWAPGLALVPLLACAGSVAPRAEEAWMEYLEIAQRLEAEGATLAPGSEEERRAVEAVKQLLGDFKAPGFVERVAEVYADGVFFNDTLKTCRGIDELQHYLASTGEGAEAVTVDFLDLTSHNGNYYFRWAMEIRFKQLAGGRPTHSVGMSHLRFDKEGRVVLHQDFWDSAGGLFDHVPVVGWMMRRIKGRL